MGARDFEGVGSFGWKKLGTGSVQLGGCGFEDPKL